MYSTVSWPHVLGNGLHVLGNGLFVLGNGPHVLGNGRHVRLCRIFRLMLFRIMSHSGLC